MAEKILIVDDEHEIANLVELYLKNENYTVYKYYTAREALECIDATELDLAILDIMLPDASGLSICQKIRDKHTYPIIMLTAKDAETDKITGLTNLFANSHRSNKWHGIENVLRPIKGPRAAAVIHYPSRHSTFPDCTGFCNYRHLKTGIFP